MKTLPLLLVLLPTLGCPTGPAGPEGPEGPRGDTGIAPTAAQVVTVLIRDHLDAITGPRGDPGTPANAATAEEVAAILVRDHLATITGPTGQDGVSPTPPTAASVAQELVTNFPDAIRGPAGAYDAVDANGVLVGRVTGLASYLWSETHQGFFWAPGLQPLGPGLQIASLFPPPGLITLHTNTVCDLVAGQTFVDLIDNRRWVWVDPLIIGEGGAAGLYGSISAPRADNVTIRSIRTDFANCATVNETRSNLVAFDTSLPFPQWDLPITLVPTTQ